MTEQVTRHIELMVPVDARWERLDKYLAVVAELGLSRTRAQMLIGNGQVKVDGEVVRSNHRVKPGQKIEAVIPPLPELDWSPEDIPFDVVYEDPYLAVVNKPAGLVTHPAKGNYSHTLVNGLVHRFGRLPSLAEGGRPGVIHRLDKQTSGLLLVAKEEKVMYQLQRMLEQRQIKRSYVALVCGHLVEDSGTIELPIGRSATERTKMAVTHENSRPAITHYTQRERFRSYDLLDVSLETGRTHQIRVHFSHLGHPVFGDPEYGGRETWVQGMFAPERPLAKRMLALIGRQALHARRLELVHPVTNTPLVCEVDPPDDFKAVLALLENEGR
ncbi:MAG: RluA family pseudouridine synthase [Candidatus Zixiibacteriota bacterium]